MTIETFSGKRVELLARFDQNVARIRDIIADPKWCNEDYKPYRDSLREFTELTRKLRTLNETEMS